MEKIKFQHPEKETGYISIDMHFHTQHSADGYTKVDSLVRSCNEKRIGAAITDHNEISGAVEAQKYGKQFIIPGIEATCREGTHLLFYFNKTADLEKFYTKEIEPYKTDDLFMRLDRNVMDLLNVYEQYNGISCAPHPCCVSWVAIQKLDNLEEALNKIDILEVITSFNTKRGNRRAVKLSEQYPYKGISAGSDGHTILELGQAMTYAKADTRKEFLEQVKNGYSLVQGKEWNISEKGFLMVLKEGKQAKNGKNLNRYRVFKNFRNIKIKNGKIKLDPPKK